MEQINLPIQKWEAKVSTSLQKTNADEIWPLFKDFFGLNKYFPGLATCHGIHGTNGESGCIRYCSGFGIKRQNGTINWSKERLVFMDPDKMTFSYEIVDSNIGFESYVSTIMVVPIEEGGSGCTVEWGISVDPVAGWKLEDLVKKYQVGLELMLRNMVAAIKSQSS